MSPIEIVLRDSDQPESQLFAPDITTALVIAGINLESGSAEIRQAGRNAINLRKRGRGLATYWEINS